MVARINYTQSRPVDLNEAAAAAAVAIAEVKLQIFTNTSAPPSTAT